ncbi:MAG: flagellar motor switch protein FliG [Rickettsiales bacterium]
MADIVNFSKLKGSEKVAIMMMALTPENAGRVFGMMHDDEIKEVSRIMAKLGTVSPDVVKQVFLEFSNFLSEAVSFVGSVESTERLLAGTLGKDRKEAIMEDIRGPAGRNTWDKLSNVSEEVLSSYLRNEYPQTATLIVSKLKPPHAAKVLAALPEDFTFDVITRLLEMDNVKKEALDSVEKALRAEFISSVTRTQRQDGSEVIAEIFNNFDRAREALYMEKLEEYAPETAERIKKLMFTFEDLAKSDAAGIQALLRVADKTQLAVAMKGASEKVRDVFVKNMSARASKILLEEIEAMGPVRLKAVDAAQSSIISAAKGLIAAGEMTVTDEEADNDVMV